jgi:hypothetical protein
MLSVVCKSLHRLPLLKVEAQLGSLAGEEASNAQLYVKFLKKAAEKVGMMTVGTERWH